MYCDSCGKEINENVVYCRYCGMKVNESKIDKLENYGVDLGGMFFSLGDLGGSNEDKANHYFKLGLEKNEEGELLEAIEYFKKSLSLNPKITNCYGNIAASYQRLQNYQEAISWYTQGLDLVPNDIMMLTNFSILFYEIDEYDEAIKLNNILILLEPDKSEHQERKSIFKQVKFNSGK